MAEEIPSGLSDALADRTLGVALSYAGEWEEAVAALDKSMGLRNGGDSLDWFFLAIAHWQLGDRGQARTWYDRAVAWMDRNRPNRVELTRFRAEADALLGPNELPEDVFARP